MTDDNHAISNARNWLASIVEMVERLRSDDDEVSEAAREEIQSSPLSVRVRGGWYSPGEPLNADPEEFEILLSTGGPALRIYGDIGGEPRLQWQDWFKPWTDYHDTTEQEDEALAEFVSCFWLGE